MNECCKDCRWWDAPDEMLRDSNKVYRTRGICNLVGAGRYGAVLIVDEGAHAELATLAGFGCVQFEEKEDQT